MINPTTLQVGAMLFSPKRQIYSIKEIKTNTFILSSWRTGADFPVNGKNQAAFWKNCYLLFTDMELEIYDKPEVEDECFTSGISITDSAKFFIHNFDFVAKKISINVRDSTTGADSDISLFAEDFGMLFNPKKDEILENEPKHNDGRDTCFWCKRKTIKQAWVRSFHDYCSNCKK
jgi:hypothetical protein